MRKPNLFVIGIFVSILSVPLAHAVSIHDFLDEAEDGGGICARGLKDYLHDFPKVDLEGKDSRLRTALHRVIDAGRSDLADVLLDYGAKPNAMHEGTTPLMKAVSHGSTGLAEVLLAHPDTEPNLLGRNHKPALQMAVESLDGHMVSVLLQERKTSHPINPILDLDNGIAMPAVKAFEHLFKNASEMQKRRSTPLLISSTTPIVADGMNAVFALVLRPKTQTRSGRQPWQAAENWNVASTWPAQPARGAFRPIAKPPLSVPRPPRLSKSARQSHAHIRAVRPGVPWLYIHAAHRLLMKLVAHR